METVFVDDSTAALNESDAAKLTAAVGEKMPVFIKFNTDWGMSGSALFSYFNVEGNDLFYTVIQIREICVMRLMGSWYALIQNT